MSIYIMSSAVDGQDTVAMHKLNDGTYQVTYGDHESDACHDQDEAVEEYLNCLSHAMTCSGCLEGKAIGMRYVDEQDLVEG